MPTMPQLRISFFLMLLIIPAFVLVGVEGYGQLGADPNAVARVGGTDITNATPASPRCSPT